MLDLAHHVTTIDRYQNILWPGLALLGVVLWIWGVVGSQLVISDTGIVDSFPLVFWVSLAIVILSYIGIAFSTPIRFKNWCLVVLLLILLVSLWLLPLVLDASLPVASHKWSKTAQFVAPILETGHLESTVGQYFNWPGLWLINVQARHLTGIETMPGQLAVNSFFPFAVSVLLALFLYILLFRVWGQDHPEQVWLGVLVFSLANYSSLVYMSPQSHGLLMFLLIMWGLVRLSQRDRPYGEARLAGIILLLIAAIVVTHLPSTVLVAGTFVVVYVGSYVFRQRVRPLNILLLSAIFVIAVSWNFTTWGSDWTTRRIPEVFAAAFDVSDLFQINIVDRVSGPASHAKIAQFRMIYSGFWLLAGFLGAVNAIRSRDRRIRTAALLMGAAFFGPALGNVAIGGQMSEMVQRVYLLSLIPISFFGVFLLLQRSTMLPLLALLLITPFFFVVVRYSDHSGDYLAPDYATAVRFFDQNTVSGSLTVRVPGSAPFGRLGMPGRFKLHSYDAAAELLPGIGDDYVILTESDRNYVLWFDRQVVAYDKVADYVQHGNDYGLVYSSPTVQIHAKP